MFDRLRGGGMRQLDAAVMSCGKMCVLCGGACIIVAYHNTRYKGNYYVLITLHCPALKNFSQDWWLHFLRTRQCSVSNRHIYTLYSEYLCSIKRQWNELQANKECVSQHVFHKICIIWLYILSNKCWELQNILSCNHFTRTYSNSRDFTLTL